MGAARPEETTGAFPPASHMPAQAISYPENYVVFFFREMVNHIWESCDDSLFQRDGHHDG